jgi:hypothetical protein
LHLIPGIKLFCNLQADIALYAVFALEQQSGG